MTAANRSMPDEAMSVLLGANILLRLGDGGSPHHAEALAAVETLDAMEMACVIVPQVLYEYWAVATRPSENNGLGLTTQITEAAIENGSPRRRVPAWHTNRNLAG